MKKQFWMKALMGWSLFLWVMPGIACDVGPNIPQATLLEELVQEHRVSKCGGFSIPKPTWSLDYCDAEILYWEFEALTGTLKLTNTRVPLNCCGQHSMQLELLDGVYVATEFDQPDLNGDRCRCICVFDFEVQAQGIQQSTIGLRLDRIITDWEEGSGTVWEGVLDLNQEHGSVVIDDQPAPTCNRDG